MSCPPGKIRNPKTGRCVSRTGKIGKLLRQRGKGKIKRKDTGKILNPKTGRYVSRTGKIGRALLAGKVAKLKPLSRKQSRALSRMLSPTKQSRALSRVLSPTVASRVSRKKVVEYADDNAQYIVIWRNYLVKRYKDVCSYETKHNRGMNILLDLDEKRLTIDPRWKTFFNKCKKRFVFEFLIVRWETKSGDVYAHANGILIDKKQKRVYHFEPNGAVSDRTIILGKVVPIVKQNFKRVFKGYSYVQPVDICPYFKGLQPTEEKHRKRKFKGEIDGYCLIWVMIFIHYCITNPKKRPSQVVKHLLSKPKELTEKVRRYATFLIRLKRKQ